MTPGFSEKPTASTQTKEEASQNGGAEFLQRVEGIRKKPTNEISIEAARKIGKETLKNFLEKNKQRIDSSSKFSLDAYAPDQDAEDLPEVCNKLARKQAKLEKLNNKLSDLEDLLDNADSSTVEQKVCAHTVREFEQEEVKLEHQIDELKKRIRKSDITLAK